MLSSTMKIYSSLEAEIDIASSKSPNVEIRLRESFGLNVNDKKFKINSSN